MIDFSGFIVDVDARIAAEGVSRGRRISVPVLLRGAL